ncbi:MAG: tetratricopeptide repeat protein [Myxococcales bacterium]
MLPARLFLALSVAAGGHSREAQMLAHQSIVDYNLGNFTAALDEAERAYRLEQKPALLYNLAQCHRALGHWSKAAFFFRGYLRSRPDAPNRAAVEALIAEMQSKAQTAASPPSPPKPTSAPAAAPPPPPAPASAPVVRTAPAAPKAAAPTETAAPKPASAEAVSAPAPAPAPATHRSHALSIGFGAGALASAGVAIAGAVEVSQWNTAAGTPGKLVYGQAPAGYQNAQTWRTVGYVAAGVAVALAVTAVFTW